jgi:peptidoglycan/xylan/chitin deacetylase (PgdA/CDA1 family)
MTRPIKSALGGLLFASRLGPALLGAAAVVVTFHRVSAAPDARGLSVSPAAFERYCRFFRRHFRVAPLRDLVTALERGEPVAGCLAITFDDGYLDNYEQAAPVLARLGLPATFFIVTQWMASDVVPWWDRDAGTRHPWMTWDDVRALRRRGFDIGAHTRTHVDLGRVSGAAAREEIGGARRELQAQLAEPVDLFAYPYGGVRHLAESNRELVRAAGFRCCCSCHGGLAPPGADPFRLRRVAVSSWYGSPEQFGLDLVRDSVAGRTAENTRCCEMSEATGC